MAQEYGDGIAWIRASMIGRGSSGRVYLATLRNPTSRNTSLPPVMAVKSAEVSSSASIQKEREAYSNLGGSPYIIKCYGEEITTGSNGAMAFNLLLEYGSGGTLSDRMKQSGGNGLAELEARLHTRSILRGLRHIHGLGYVHCDMKPDNIMLVPNGGLGAKIGDLGLAKRVKQSRKRKLGACWEGTPMYLSPEAVVEHVQEAPSDVWAVGCIVLEMLTGKSPLGGKKEMRAVEILREIGAGHGRIEIPTELSKEARAFLKGCFVKNPNFRLTCEMLLNHSFLEGLEEDGGDLVDENEIESFGLVSGSDDDDDDEFSSDSWSDGSEADSFSEGDSTNTNDDEPVSKAEEEAPQVVGIGGFTDDFLRSNQTSKSSSTARLHYPVGLNIPAGILQKIR